MALAVRPPLILAYHGLGSVPRSLDPSNLYVRPEAFREQVESLLRRGYRFVTMSELADRMAAAASLRGLCALTFDDGSEDNATVLPGLLEALGVPATLYVCPGLMGEPHPFLAPEAGFRLATAEQVAALAERPDVELGSHTNTHAVLKDAPRDIAHREMVESKAALEALAGRPVRSFAYPECGYSPGCVEAAPEAGYSSAVTCGMRGGWQPYELARISIDPLDNRLTWALKRRDLWRRAHGSAPGRLARAIARPLRHAR
jgi:peptidoglycan/xylan/chitin deacetylase (PgdA/CDA1 family)